MLLNEDALVDIIKRRASTLQPCAIILPGSFARDEADIASDIDVLVLTCGDQRYIQTGVFGGHAIEILYLPLEMAKKAPVHQATFHQARPLWDPEGIGAAWLETQEAIVGSPRAVSDTEVAYVRWDLAQSLETLHYLAARDRVAFLYSRNHWVQVLVTAVFARAGVWAPTVRRQMGALAEQFPALYPLVVQCLEADTPKGAAEACRRALHAVYGESPHPSLDSAPVLPMD